MRCGSLFPFSSELINNRDIVFARTQSYNVKLTYYTKLTNDEINAKKLTRFKTNFYEKSEII